MTRLSPYDAIMDNYKEFHYSIELNRNDIFSKKEDTYKDDYKFYILTSDFSFSRGNPIPIMAKQDGVTISASKAVVALALLGLLMMALNTSMPYQICSLDEETQLYKNNDDGIPVDDELMVETWYDLSFG